MEKEGTGINGSLVASKSHFTSQCCKNSALVGSAIYISEYPCARNLSPHHHPQMPSLSQNGSSGGLAFLNYFGFKEDVIVFTNLNVVFQETQKIVTASEPFIFQDFAVTAKVDELGTDKFTKISCFWILR